MYNIALGRVIFDCRVGLDGTVGIRDEFSNVYRGDTEHVKIAFGIDFACDYIKPAMFDGTLCNFKPLSSVIESSQTVLNDLNNYNRSNRATYSLIPPTMLMCFISGTVNLKTYQWQDDTFCRFYRLESIVDMTPEITGKPLMRGQKKGVLASQVVGKPNSIGLETCDLVNTLEKRFLANVADALDNRSTLLCRRLGIK